MINIGILSPASIAINRFLPALSKVTSIKFKGVAIANIDERGELFVDGSIEKSLYRAQKIIDLYGGDIYESFHDMLNDDDIDAVYVPLPPILHYRWAKAALLKRKHVFMEKPFTINLNETNDLIRIAKSIDIAIYENYMFVHHTQLSEIRKIINNGTIGDVRDYKISFGFPLRDTKIDFRYKKEYGGGAIFDCAGYPIKLASLLLKEAKVVYCNLNYDNPFGIDLFGSIVMEGKDGITAELSFGMDNGYKCSLEVWGCKGLLVASRIFTAPNDFNTEYELIKDNKKNSFKIGCDDAFYKSIIYFVKAINSFEIRKNIYDEIEMQAKHVNDALRLFDEK